jgi:hypothetical protein
MPWNSDRVRKGRDSTEKLQKQIRKQVFVDQTGLRARGLLECVRAGHTKGVKATVKAKGGMRL